MPIQRVPFWIIDLRVVVRLHTNTHTEHTKAVEKCFNFPILSVWWSFMFNLTGKTKGRGSRAFNYFSWLNFTFFFIPSTFLPRSNLFISLSLSSPLSSFWPFTDCPSNLSCSFHETTRDEAKLKHNPLLFASAHATTMWGLQSMAGKMEKRHMKYYQANAQK